MVRGRWVVVGILVAGVLLGTAALAQTGIKIVVSGREIEPDVPPQIVNGRTMVPLRFVAEALDAGVSWDESTRTVSVYEFTIISNVEQMRARLGDLDAVLGEAKVRARSRVRLTGEDLSSFAFILSHLWRISPAESIKGEALSDGETFGQAHARIYQDATLWYTLSYLEYWRDANSPNMTEAERVQFDAATRELRALVQ